MSDALLKEIQAVSAKIDDNKNAVSKEVAELKAAAEKEQKLLSDKVEEMNKTLAEKDAKFIDISNEVKELKAKGGRFAGGAVKFEGLRRTIANEVCKAIGEKKEEIMGSEKGAMMKPVEIKTVGDMVSGNLATDNFISYLDWASGMEPTGQFHFRNLCRTILSQTDFVQFPRANTPIGEGSFGRQATEGDTKAQVDRDYTMIELTLKPMAAYAVASRQSLRNILFLQSWLPTSLMDQMEDSEDTNFANSLVAAATGSSTASGITVAAEKLIFYIKNLIAAKYNPNGIASDPTNWATIMVTKPSDYSLPGVVSIDTNGNTRILGRPFYPVNWLTGNRVVVGDWTKAAIVQSEGLTLRQTDSHASLFTSNEVTFLLERTEGLAIFRPDAFVTTTF